MSHVLGQATGDSSFQEEREQNFESCQSSSDHFKAGLIGLTSGIFGGMTSILTQPYKGAVEEGVGVWLSASHIPQPTFAYIYPLLLPPPAGFHCGSGKGRGRNHCQASGWCHGFCLGYHRCHTGADKQGFSFLAPYNTATSMLCGTHRGSFLLLPGIGSRTGIFAEAQ